MNPKSLIWRQETLSIGLAGPHNVNLNQTGLDKRTTLKTMLKSDYWILGQEQNLKYQ